MIAGCDKPSMILRSRARISRIKFYADTCYYAEQAAQEALKGYFVRPCGERIVPAHALTDLVQRVGMYDAQYRVFASGASTLTQYYIPMRYPDALPGSAAPFEVYTEAQASDAIRIAEGILKKVQETG